MQYILHYINHSLFFLYFYLFSLWPLTIIFLAFYDFNGDAVIGNQVQKPTVQATKKRLKKLLKTSIKSATRKNKKSKKAKVVLKKITKVKGVRYQIKYASNKKFKKAKVKTFKNYISIKTICIYIACWYTQS